MGFAQKDRGVGSPRAAGGLWVPSPVHPPQRGGVRTSPGTAAVCSPTSWCDIECDAGRGPHTPLLPQGPSTDGHRAPDSPSPTRDRVLMLTGHQALLPQVSSTDAQYIWFQKGEEKIGSALRGSLLFPALTDRLLP